MPKNKLDAVSFCKIPDRFGEEAARAEEYLKAELSAAVDEINIDEGETQK